MDSPPIPVADGSPTWARKSLETKGNDSVRFNPHEAGAVTRTIEEGIEIVVVDFAEFEKVFACFWASIYLEINDNVAQRCLEQDRHDHGRSVRWRKRTSATVITRDEARRSANGCTRPHLNLLFNSLRPRGATRWPRSSPNTRPTLSKSPLQMLTTHAASVCYRLVEGSGPPTTTR